MLKPITEAERAKYTIKIHTERATQELLAEAYESGYNGYIDIWPIIKTKKDKLVLELKSKKVSTAVESLTSFEAVRYHVAPNKGVKKIK